MRLSLKLLIYLLTIAYMCCARLSYSNENTEVIGGINPIQLVWSESIKGETSGSRTIKLGDRTVKVISLYKLPNLNSDESIQLLIESGLIHDTKNESKTIFYPSLMFLNDKYEITNDYPSLSYQHNKGFFSQGAMKADLILEKQLDEHKYLAVYSNPNKIGQEYSYCVTDYTSVFLGGLTDDYIHDDSCSTVNYSNVGVYYLSINKYDKPKDNETFSKMERPLKGSDIADISRYCYETQESPVECMNTYGYSWDGNGWNK